MRIRLVAGTMMIEAMLHILRVIFPCSRTPCGKNTSTCMPNARGWGGGRYSDPYISYIDMCIPKGYGFSAVFVIKRVSILASFGHFGHK